ncbi:glycoprotein-N-acetylgalactosamine 3-beta-galactosyltransferase 1-like isoform X2 [Sitophilus oryzae]|uniref:Glycoprotein-N-acetylgalactosamine 3-beta-galactosyltransferase 1 n=1 Tax=Sitophilus oryzae TaxID=7048 RepID=A0A6J2YMA1_SITOR|nr:glycoprotein-N-acetylgalactosamine 3-beta-galactosyltransferase 1-like isoform X2 [Sitophilus oryzae]
MYTSLNPELKNRLTRLARLFCVTPLFSGIIIGVSVTCFLFLLFPQVIYNNKYYDHGLAKNQDSYLNDAQTDVDVIYPMLNKTVAHTLYEEVNVLCWVTTSPENHQNRAKHVKATWGQRCNTLIFISTKEDDDIPTVALPVEENRDNLWGKTRLALQYLYENYYDQADWFLKTDDDTYVIVENLRYMLYTQDPELPVYLGCKFKPFINQGYMSGGAGYVLSKAALKKFATEALPNKTICKEEPLGNEDVELGRCLEAIDVKAANSRDSGGRMRFLPLNLKYFMIPGTLPSDTWLWKYLYYPIEEGISCCSDVAITFHYVRKEEMYIYDYLLYHLRPFGIGFEPKLPEKYQDLHQTVQ